MATITTTTYKILDSAGNLADGWIYFRQTARYTTASELVTTVQGRERVIKGVFANSVVIPTTPADEFVEVWEDFRKAGTTTERVSYYTHIGSAGSYEYALLPQDTPPTPGNGAPGWVQAVIDAGETAEASAAAAAASAAEAAAAVASLPEDLTVEDGAIAALVSNPASQTGAEVSATVDAAVAGSILSRSFGIEPTTNLHPTQKVVAGGLWFSAGAGTGGTVTHGVEAGTGAFGSDAYQQTWTAPASAGGGGISTGIHNDLTGTKEIRVDPGEVITASLYVESTVAGTFLCRISWADAAGAILSATDGVSVPLLANEKRRIIATGTAPANTARISVSARTNTASAMGTGKIRASWPSVVRGSIAKRRVAAADGAVVLGVTDQSPVVGKPEAVRYAHWGDSIAFGGTTIDSPVALVGSTLDAPVHNGGVSGESSTQIRTRQNADTLTRDWVQILGLGHNGASGGVGPIVTDIQACVDHLTGSLRFLVLELIPWANHDAGQRANYNAAIAATKAAFPANFVEVAKWLRSQASATAMGITFSGTDLSDIAAGHTPTVYRTDDIHLNLLGRKAYAYRIAQEMTIRGWV